MHLKCLIFVFLSVRRTAISELGLVGKWQVEVLQVEIYACVNEKLDTISIFGLLVKIGCVEVHHLYAFAKEKDDL